MMDGKTMQCPLCGCQFDKGSQPACASCPLAGKHCHLICCPQCGYQWTEESQIIATLKKWFGKKEVQDEKED